MSVIILLQLVDKIPCCLTGDLVDDYSLLFPRFKNIAPIKPAASGVNCDKGPKNAVKLVPIQDIAKSTTANPIRSIPII